MNADFTAQIARYYDDKLARHGPTARGVDWRDEASQSLRFTQFERLWKGDAGFSLLDVGCGYGALLPHLRERGCACDYHGIDLAEGMIATARRLHVGDPQAHFRHGGDIDTDYDYIVASGIFNVRPNIPEADWQAWVDEQAARIAQRARRGFALNFLTDRADQDRMRADLHYASPTRWLTWGLTISRHVALLHDYGLWEFTLLVRYPSR